MIGVQWCDECDAPRFKWSCGGIHDVPSSCYYQTDHTVALRFVADGLAEARRKLAAFAHGSIKGSPHSGARSRRRTHVRERFDQVIGWWARQPTVPRELMVLLREYNNRGRSSQAAGERTSAALPETGRLVDVVLLHSLTEEMKALAEQERAREKPVLPQPAAKPGSWRMVQRPRPDTKSDIS